MGRMQYAPTLTDEKLELPKSGAWGPMPFLRIHNGRQMVWRIKMGNRCISVVQKMIMFFWPSGDGCIEYLS